MRSDQIIRVSSQRLFCNLKLGSLLPQASVEKTSVITENIGVVYSGLAPDFRLLVKKGQCRVAHRSAESPTALLHNSHSPLRYVTALIALSRCHPVWWSLSR